MDRRTFLKTTAAGSALVGVGAGLPGCGNAVVAAPLADVLVSPTPMLPQATLNDTLGSVGYGTIQLQVPFYRDLAQVGGAITLRIPRSVDPSDQNRSYGLPPDNTVLVVQRVAGEFSAFQSHCPHAGCPLGYSAQDDRIECPCHSSRFLAANDPVDKTQCAGAVTHSPAASSLTTWNTTYDAATQVLTIDLTMPLACNNTFPPLVGTTLTLPLANFPQLGMAGGSATGQPMGVADPIVVMRLDATTAAALDARCTHRGCTVLWTPERMDLECPCHGSIFGTDGSVKTPPATTPLKSYQTVLTADSIVVTVV